MLAYVERQASRDDTAPPDPVTSDSATACSTAEPELPYRLDVFMDVRRSLMSVKCPRDGACLIERGGADAARIGTFVHGHLTCHAARDATTPSN